MFHVLLTMASYNELELEYSCLGDEGDQDVQPSPLEMEQVILQERTAKSDLQLAAELGKTLLERNKELENNIKILQGTIDDQLQEIEYLTKQTVALKEVNDSRLRIYEQLDVSISDLERANHRLVVENATEKKKVKTLTSTVESLETKCEEYQSLIDDLRLENECYKRKAQQAETPTRSTCHNRMRLSSDKFYDDCSSPDYYAAHTETVMCDSSTTPEKSSSDNQKQKSPQNSNRLGKYGDSREDKEQEEEDKSDVDIEQISQVMGQLREVRSQCAKDQRRIAELEDQVSTYIQQNQALENQLVRLHHKEEEAKSMHEELTTLEEVRQGQLCSRCLRTVDDPRTDENMSMSLCDEPEDDEASMVENGSPQQMFRTSFHMDVQDQSTNNPYRELVEKYEALIEIQKHKLPNSQSANYQTSKQKRNKLSLQERNNLSLQESNNLPLQEGNSLQGDSLRDDSLRSNSLQEGNSLSLQEELQMSGDFSVPPTKDTDEESGHGSSLKTEKQENKNRKIARTPTDFSEAETSSSGFSDETSNKSTQTDGRPGSFLCTIADGEDKFSIYDDASPIESRFRNRPEYRHLFKEIFSVLKKAAKNKDDNEELPLLDDHSPTKTPKVPPVTPCTENLPDFPDSFTDDTQSILSSTVSELSTNQVEPLTVIENLPSAYNQQIMSSQDSIQNSESFSAENIPTKHSKKIPPGSLYNKKSGGKVIYGNGPTGSYIVANSSRNRRSQSHDPIRAESTPTKQNTGINRERFINRDSVRECLVNKEGINTDVSRESIGNEEDIHDKDIHDQDVRGKDIHCRDANKETTPNKEAKQEYVLRPLVRQPLEYIAVSVNVRKRSSSRRKKQLAERSDSPATIIVGSPKVTYSNRPSSGRSRRRETRGNVLESENWNGSTVQFWARNNVSSPTPSQKGYDSTFEFKPSTASQDLHKLKNLDMSYAEVLKYPSKKREVIRGRRK